MDQETHWNNIFLFQNLLCSSLIFMRLHSVTSATQHVCQCFWLAAQTSWRRQHLTCIQTGALREQQTAKCSHRPAGGAVQGALIKFLQLVSIFSGMLTLSRIRPCWQHIVNAVEGNNPPLLLHRCLLRLSCSAAAAATTAAVTITAAA